MVVVVAIVVVDAGGGGRWKDKRLRDIFDVCVCARVCEYDYISILNYQHFLIVIVFTTSLLPLPLTCVDDDDGHHYHPPPALTATTPIDNDDDDPHHQCR